MTHVKSHSLKKYIVRWLYLCAFIVFGIVVIGGITRLTRSGLSIVEWKPISGVIPPLSEAHWVVEFEKYQATPEYRMIHHAMTLPEFKFIFWWEFMHRILARLIGFVFFIPFMWFLIKRQISSSLGWRFSIIFLLGGFQGFLGWYMVKSGLVNNPHVSHLRLMSHLMTAVLIYALILWTAWGLRVRPVYTVPRREAWFLVCFSFLIIASGALVAGLHAGKLYNTWPLMYGEYFPQGMMAFAPWYQNLIENPIMVQFTHRNLAYLFGVVLAWQLYKQRFNLTFHHPLMFIAAAYVLQFILGVLTLLNGVPVSLGALHQANALLLFTTTLWLLANSTQYR